MFRPLLVAALAISTWSTAACRTRHESATAVTTMPGAVRLEALTRSQYEVLGRTEGEACADYYALWPLPIFWVRSDDQDGVPHPRATSALMRREARRALASANYKAIALQPDADTILMPRYQVSRETKGIWYRRACVRVEGKAIRLKLDDELSPAQQSERPQTVEAVVRP
ncbi:MAG: hypothetical protein AB1Z98_24585 [Nannocystaceae bacterium]